MSTSCSIPPMRGSNARVPRVRASLVQVWKCGVACEKRGEGLEGAAALYLDSAELMRLRGEADHVSWSGLGGRV
jgi:hypothetical protein